MYRGKKQSEDSEKAVFLFRLEPVSAVPAAKENSLTVSSRGKGASQPAGNAIFLAKQYNRAIVQV